MLPRGQHADHPRFFARIGSPSNPISVLADLIGTGHNTFAGSWTGGAGATALELTVVDWLRGWMGMPPETEGILVSELLAGIERADSLVLDPHKWLFQPYEIGCVLVNHPGLLQHTFTLDGAYLRDTTDDHVQLRERGPQLTRSSRALKLWLSLTTFGFDAFRDAIARGIELAEHAEATLRAADWEIASPASLGVVTFHRPDVDSEALVRRITASGYAAPSTTILEGRTVARLCTINPRTTKRDIERTIERLEK